MTRLVPEMPPPRNQASARPEPARPTAKTIDLASFRLRRALRGADPSVPPPEDRIAAA